MDDYTTTIGRTIYSGHMNEESVPTSLVVHELTHVMQWNDEGLYFALDFLFSKDKRAYYESEAGQAEMLLSKNIMTDAWLHRKATQLVGYGCKYEVALSELQARRSEVDRDQPQKAPSRVVTAVALWKAERDSA
jgi:hypothetical protein